MCTSRRNSVRVKVSACCCSPLRTVTSWLRRSISNGPCRISPLGSSVTVLALRRSTAWMRATISAGLNGLAT
ncbi:hypothetical protein G6F50_017708 [Rhizopus delemar]|uniref:Uncharacterized protein n=1 Tax=Rhizopus delemar TaxID=936053 RepID=A0A9P7BZX4_9FUNG|nr:hypothetical protein G6F23_016039 [Rhizopus arrhizus]KAG1529864.1 hypothetical protein G6F50_017708 [Rhizopus delemar]